MRYRSIRSILFQTSIPENPPAQSNQTHRRCDPATWLMRFQLIVDLLRSSVNCRLRLRRGGPCLNRRGHAANVNDGGVRKHRQCTK